MKILRHLEIEHKQLDSFDLDLQVEYLFESGLLLFEALNSPERLEKK
jgi:hypothetical protein